jgi:hypothetical protein
MKIRHNKKRNTAFLYEALIREFVKANLEKDEDTKKAIKGLIFEFFNSKKILGKEYALYKAVLETKGSDPLNAEKILYEIKRVYASFGNKEVFNQQSSLIRKTNKNVGQHVWTNYVSNYKTLATLDQIFKEKTSIPNRILLENSILKMMTKRVLKEDIEQHVDNLVVSTFIRSYNKKYGNLLKEQKKLIRRFIDSDQEETDYLVFLNEELQRLKKVLSEGLEMKEIKEDPEMIHKTKKVLNILNEFKNRPIFKEKDLIIILEIQKLVKEIND